MNATWAQMRRASTLAAYARMMAEAKKQQDEGKTENTTEAAEPKVEEAPKEEPKTEEPEIEESLTEEPAPVEESSQDNETVQDSPINPDLSEKEEASE